MLVHRCTIACPRCNKQEEVWYYNCKIVPSNSISCNNCSYIFEADQYINVLLTLRENISVTTKLYSSYFKSTLANTSKL